MKKQDFFKILEESEVSKSEEGKYYLGDNLSIHFMKIGFHFCGRKIAIMYK